jgi:hypothetical protein
MGFAEQPVWPTGGYNGPFEFGGQMKDDVLNRTKVKRGSQLPWAKLTEDDVALIRAMVDEREATKARLRDVTNAKIAEKFGVHVRTIDRVTTGEGWGHVA